MIKSKTLNNSLNKCIYDSQAVFNREKSLATQRGLFLFLSLKSNGTPIDKELLIKNHEGEEFVLNNKITSKKLVFRYGELHCDVCVDEQVKSLKKYKEKIGSDNIIILADYNSIKNLILFKRLNSIELPIYRLSEKFNLELEKKEVPYFFVIDDNFINGRFKDSHFWIYKRPVTI